MPVFDVVDFIAYAVDSALSQSWPSIEVIIVDDGSSDGTEEYLRIIKDERVTVISQSNKGSSVARNVGVKLAKGDFVAFLDGDDVWHPQKLERQMALIQENALVDLVFSRSRLIDADGTDTGRRSIAVTGPVEFNRLICENVVNNGSAALLRKSAIEQAGGFDAELKSCVDHDLWIRVASLRKGNVVGTAEVLIDYRLRSGQITKDWRRVEEGWLMLVHKLQRSGLSISASARAEMVGRMYRYLSYIAYETGDLLAAKKLFFVAFRAYGLRLLQDRRSIVLAAALLSRVCLPLSLHRELDGFVRKLRAR